ncbi:MAG: cbb3-type cytochrome c oxidase subunit 3 [Fluviicola sp.]|jgi:fructose-specific phosphotransferase system IIC component|nr:cbb3-type cytochrome c oxidase subunit 3 [Fluviicola sp.]
MLRFIKHHLTGIDGVSIYPIISLLIFVLFFVFVLTHVFRMRKTQVEELSNIPFETSEEEVGGTVGIIK